MNPTVLHFIVCDRVRVDATNLHLINIEGLRTSIRSTSTPPFPCVVPSLTVLAIFMGGDGYFDVWTRIVDDDTDKLLSTSTTPHQIHLIGDPFDVNGVMIVIPNCTFLQQGLYWVELVLSGETIARQPIRVRL